MKKKILVLLTIFMLGLLTGCGYLEPSDVDKRYVKKEFEEWLEGKYGVEFVVKVKEFNENSDKRESLAIAYPKIDSTLTFEITGSIERDCLSYDDCYGSSYHKEENFADLLIGSIEEKLNGKYVLEFGKGADLRQVGENVKNYLRDFRELLMSYSDGSEFDHYFDEDFLRGDVPLTLNGKSYKINVIIDEDNDKVVIDTSQGEYGWIGELEVYEWLEYKATGVYDEKVKEIKCKHYQSSSYCK